MFIKFIYSVYNLLAFCIKKFHLNAFLLSLFRKTYRCFIFFYFKNEALCIILFLHFSRGILYQVTKTGHFDLVSDFILKKESVICFYGQPREKEKTPFQKFLDCVIVLFPILCGAIAVAEYLLVPDSFTNSNPNTYLYLLVILIALYTVRAIVALVKYAMNDKPFFQKVRYKAPLHAAFFLLLTAYDYLTLKTGILDQPFIPCLNSILNIAWEDREMLIVSTLYTLRLLFTGYFIGSFFGLITGITCGYSKRMRYWVDPIIKFMGPIPTSTWIPIMMVLPITLSDGAVFPGLPSPSLR